MTSDPSDNRESLGTGDIEIGGSQPTAVDHVRDERLHKKGMPMWIFKVMRCMQWICPFDYWVAFPLIIILAICALGVLLALIDLDRRQFVLYILIAFFVSLALGFWIRWARRNKRVPQEHDVLKISISAGKDTWPRAPIAPVRGELVAKGGSWFKDSEGRRLLLRGINLAGGCKLPMEPASCNLKEGFYDYKGVSFVGRPFPLDEADLHLGRLRAMGLTFLRFLITWEAIEHDGPEQYDEEYLIYLKIVVQRCADHGISVFIDTHQDVWSRWTGGDGAPAWTLEKVGFALDKLDECGAALTQQNWDEEANGKFPKMVWNSNNSRLAAGTMWTLFFAGDDFAPSTLIDGEPAQQYLQRHFCAALGKVAEILRNEPNVVGFDVLNEPSVGFVGIEDARDIGPNMFFVGWRVDPWTAIKLGAGETCSVDYFSSFMVIDGKRELNPNKVCAWQNGPASCVWHANGVWELEESTGKPCLLKPHYFATNPRTGLPIDFLNDYAIPFWRKTAETIRSHISDAIIFAEPVLDMTDPSLQEMPELNAEEVGAGYVWARHYYDGITLMTKNFSRYLGIDPVSGKPNIGMQAIQKAYGKSIAQFKEEASRMGPGGCPVLIGECGIPFDLHDQKRIHGQLTDDFTKCTQALNTTMRALEHAQVSYTIWTYAPENTNKYGDNWNGEDLSLFSRDQVVRGDEDNLFTGGRALLAAIRPYPCRVAGDVIGHDFYLYTKKRKFVFSFRADHTLTTRETEIFLPKYQYPHGVNVTVSRGGGTYELDWDSQRLLYTHNAASTVNTIVVKKILAPSDAGTN
jgi:hypothetical protein